MHVAVIASSETSGGAEEYLYRLYHALSRDHGVRVTVLGQFPEWPREIGETVDVGAGPKFTRRRGLPVQAIETMSYIPQVLRSLGELHPDVVHIQYFREKIFLPWIVSRSYPLVWTEHAPLPTNFPMGGRRLVARQSRFARVIAVSNGVARDLSLAGIDSTVIANPVPQSIGVQRRHGGEASAPADAGYVLYVGRLHANKRVDLLLDVARVMPDRRFVIAGTGPAAGTLASSAPPNVDFIGHVAVSDDLYRNSRAVVITSGRPAREGLPMALLEARSVGARVMMASDCHAADDALALGGEVFEPTVDALATTLAREEAMSIENPMSGGLSETEWARMHHKILNEAINRGAR